MSIEPFRDVVSFPVHSVLPDLNRPPTAISYRNLCLNSIPGRGMACHVRFVLAVERHYVLRFARGPKPALIIPASVFRPKSLLRRFLLSHYFPAINNRHAYARSLLSRGSVAVAERFQELFDPYFWNLMEHTPQGSDGHLACATSSHLLKPCGHVP
jgi:hypothetical protein